MNRGSPRICISRLPPPAGAQLSRAVKLEFAEVNSSLLWMAHAHFVSQR